MNVVGPGQIAGIRAVFSLPSRGSFYHSLSLGPDYKHFDQTVGLGGSANDMPVTYMPLTVSYGATLQEPKALTQLDVGATAGLRGVGSGPTEFDNKRYLARTNFFLLKGDVSRTQELPQDFELYGKVQGQVADQALVSSEQLSFAALLTVRGYLELEELGDNGVAGTLELRSPDLAPKLRAACKDADGKPTFDNLRRSVSSTAGLRRSMILSRCGKNKQASSNGAQVSEPTSRSTRISTAWSRWRCRWSRRLTR